MLAPAPCVHRAEADHTGLVYGSMDAHDSWIAKLLMLEGVRGTVRSGACSAPAKLARVRLACGLLWPLPGRSTETTRMLRSSRTAESSTALSRRLPEVLGPAAAAARSAPHTTAHCDTAHNNIRLGGHARTWLARVYRHGRKPSRTEQHMLLSSSWRAVELAEAGLALHTCAGTRESSCRLRCLTLDRPAIGHPLA